MREKGNTMDQECKQKPWVNLFTKDLYFGAEGDEGDSNDESGDDKSGDEGDAGSASNDSSTNSSNDDDKHDDKDDPAVQGLKSALATERAAAKKAAKELKALQAKEAERELADKTEVEQAAIKQKNAEERAERLASGLLRRDLDTAIRLAAKDFVDPTDAIDGVDRSKLTYEQDEDDPTNITIDEKSVEKAVKALSTRKPHFLKTGTDDGEPTGSSFGGSKKAKGDRDATLKAKYASLNH